MSTGYQQTLGDGIVVVQGQSVRQSSGSGGGGFSQTLNQQQQQHGGGGGYKYAATASVAQHQTPEPPARGCRDVLFAVLFYAHLGLIAWAAAEYVPIVTKEVGENVVSHGNGGRRLNDGQQGQEQNEENNNNANTGSIENFEPVHLAMIVAISAAIAFLASSAALSFMMACAQPLIKAALIFNIGLFGILAAVSFLGGSVGMGVVLLLMALLSAYYAYRVWVRIPFAASNLVTAIMAIRANLGLAVYAYWSVIVLFLWSIVWALSASSTVYVKADCNPDGECQGDVSGILIFLFFLSYYWTAQVISNVVHVTTAGTVGTWWFHPEQASGCCSRAVRDSYGRSLTTSFGSICLGSLLVAIIQALKEMVHQMRDMDDSIGACIATCILGCIESLVEYFNKWAFVYVGLYGYGFMEAGSNVMSLFRSRGWTAIISDVMVDTVLFMVSLGVAVIVGILSLVVGAALEVEDDATLVSAFLLGSVVGYAVCATLFSLVSSGVNTVIVCYAEAPNEFHANHPELAAEMQASWRQAWPNQFDY